MSFPYFLNPKKKKKVFPVNMNNHFKHKENRTYKITKIHKSSSLHKTSKHMKQIESLTPKCTHSIEEVALVFFYFLQASQLVQ